MSIINVISREIIEIFSQGNAPFFISICGSADTGKSTLAENLSFHLSKINIRTDWMSTDAFLNERQKRNKLGISGYNPQSIDATGILNAILSLRNKEIFEYSPYDNKLGRKVKTKKRLIPQDIVIFEGIHSFHNCISKYINFKIFINADDDTLKKMRYRGNLFKRGMNSATAGSRIDDELNEFKTYILPNKDMADLTLDVDFDFSYKVSIQK